MGIKKIVKISFILIILLIIILSTINILVLSQIGNNTEGKKRISEIVSLQEQMNALTKDAMVSADIAALEGIKENFVNVEEKFEQSKALLIAQKPHLIILDRKKYKVIEKNLELLYKNEKDIEIAFAKAYDLHKKKIELEEKFNKKYPLEEKLRKELRRTVSSSGNFSLLNIMGSIEYYSKETLYQNKNQKSLQKWLDKIELLKDSESYFRGVDRYKQVAKEVAFYPLKIQELQNVQKQLTDKIIEIIKLNSKLNASIDTDMEDISSRFIKFIYIFIFIISGFAVSLMLFMAYKVNKNVGLSVDEIETKVQKGLTEIKALDTEIEATQREVIFTMGAIGEQRSKETGNHVKRVAEYTKLLALSYGLSEHEADMLKLASPMHDIGKIAIPDAILNKPGRFNEQERKIMDTHANLGYEMLKGSNRSLLKIAAIVAREHHEKWDGSGYPQGKNGDEIHIYGRITALADVFDALGSDRVYKKAWNDEKIFQFFKEERGVHFDPKLIDIFFEKLDEFLKIRDDLKDNVV